MSAFFHGQHLDAFAGREVVFCHNCSHEWYRDTGDLQCPRCTSEATEIVSDRENDPRGNLEERDMDHEPNLHDDGIERQFRRGPGGLFFSRTTYRSPSRHEPGAASGPVHPADPQAILNRFAEMVGDLDPGRSASDGPALAPEAPFARATILRSSFGNGQTGFTITTPPVRVERGGHGAPQDVANDFAMLFGTIMGNITPQAGNSPFGNASNANSANPADRGGVNAGNDMGPGGQQPPHGFPLQFHQLISALFGPAGTANWGDVVTSQQELDRIISNLMEVNPQSNAAPPASQAALDRLERKKLDSTMVGSGERAECTICIDELHRGDEVTVLPCKHWFHGDCVVLWLKEHNTCPICRAPIENKSQSAASPQRQRQGQGSGSGWRNSTGGSVPSASLFDLRFPGRFPGYSDTAGESSASASNAPQPTTDPSPTRPAADGSSSNYRRRQVRSPSENEQRLNAIRSATFSMGMPGDSGGNNNNNSNSRYRRNSLSPPSAGSQQQQQEQRRTVLHNARTRDPGPAEPSFWSFGSASADQERNQDGERDRTSGLFGDRSHRHSQRPGGGNGNNGEGDSSSGNSTSAPRSLANWLRGLGGSGSSSGNGNGDSRRH